MFNECIKWSGKKAMLQWYAYGKSLIYEHSILLIYPVYVFTIGSAILTQLATFEVIYCVFHALVQQLFFIVKQQKCFNISFKSIEIICTCSYQWNFLLQVHPTNPLFYIKILLNISALMSLYVFNLLLKAAFGIAEANYHLLAKYAIIMVYIILSNLQPLILSLFATYNIIPCVTLYSSKSRASRK